MGKGLHGRGGSRCRHCWVKYFHKNTTFDSKLFKSSNFKENRLKLLYFGSILCCYHFGRYAQLYSAKFQALNGRFVTTYGSEYHVSSCNFPEGYGSECPKIGHSVESIYLLLRSCLI